MKKDTHIQIIRIVAMLSIILCHIVQESNNKYIVMSGQFFNIGVYIFLLISGYLYSNKTIEIKKFYKDRFFKIILPMYLFLIPIYCIQLNKGTFDIWKFLTYLLNLQGVFNRIPGAAHLWFLTAIFLCYLVLPGFQKIREDRRKIKYFNIILAVTTFTLCYLNRNLGTIFVCLCTYSIGYFYLRKIYTMKVNKIIIIIVFIFDLGLRLIFKMLFDETILYDLIIVGITQIIASICIILLIKKINLEKISNSKIINLLDKYSFYVYITHYFFMTGSASVMSVTPYLGVNTVIMLFLSVGYAIILFYINDLIINRIKLGEKNEIKR